MNSHQLCARSIQQVAHIDKVLREHTDQRIRDIMEEALNRHKLHGPVALYKYLYECAEKINPYKCRTNPGKWRKKCSKDAFVRGNQRCLMATLFYEMAEGSYFHSNTLSKCDLTLILPEFD